jgi:hypothetical protein
MRLGRCQGLIVLFEMAHTGMQKVAWTDRVSHNVKGNKNDAKLDGNRD